MPNLTKLQIRKRAKTLRANLKNLEAGENLVAHFPYHLPCTYIAGFAPIDDEIDLWPLLKNLVQNGQNICLPVIGKKNSALSFRIWTPDSEMQTDRYGVSFPISGKTVTPDLLLLPLLAFTDKGERLGYGGGYYDRTLEMLRRSGEVFACGVAYAGQEVEALPTEPHDAKLDGILTEDGFKAFA